MLRVMIKLSAILAAALSFLQANADFELVDRKLSVADIVVSKNHKRDFQAAAEFLADYVHRASQVKPQIVDKSSRQRIEFQLDKNFDQDEFSITFPAKEVLLITGGSPMALEYAVSELLERYVGVRWLFPGPLGEVTPMRQYIAVPEKPMRQCPVFLSRCIGTTWQNTPFERGWLAVWFKRLRRTGNRISFIHNLYNTFPVKLFGKSHPEFYPILNGKRYVPPESDRQRWQPCFSAPGIVEAGIKRVKEYVRNHPHESSYSLGINDSDIHCTCAKCIRIDGHKKTWCGAWNRANTYIGFCNKVAEAVRREYPRIWFGFLAYECILEPPDGEVHPALVPYICFDRMMWLDSQRAAFDRKVTEKWHEKSPVLGWYDYIYGRIYQLPRLYPHLMSEYLKWGARHGVQHYYAEAQPSEDWHEGPKYYIAAKLLWNPEQNVDALLDDWCRAAVGTKAAPLLRKYYDHLEDYWQNRIARTEWFQKIGGYGNNIYLDFTSERYMAAYTEADVAYCERLLNKVVELAEDNRPRAKFIRQAFLNRKPGLLAWIRNHELNCKPEHYQFDKTLFSSDFDRMDGIGTWQSKISKGKFIHAQKIGRSGSIGIGMDLKGCAGTMTYLAYMPETKAEFFKASIWVRSENVKPEAEVKLTFRWQASKTSDHYSSKVDWLPTIYDSKVIRKLSGDTKWQKLVVYVRRPQRANLRRLVLMFGVIRPESGKVIFDDLTVETSSSKE